MNRYLIIDKNNFEIIDTKNLKGDFDQFGSSVTCTDVFDLYKEAVSQLVEDIKFIGNNSEERVELLNELIEKLEDLKKEV
jgi:hypothetical protein